jgi:hypothetical protein
MATGRRCCSTFSAQQARRNPCSGNFRSATGWSNAPTAGGPEPGRSQTEYVGPMQRNGQRNGRGDLEVIRFDEACRDVPAPSLHRVSRLERRRSRLHFWSNGGACRAIAGERHSGWGRGCSGAVRQRNGAWCGRTRGRRRFRPVRVVQNGIHHRGREAGHDEQADAGPQRADPPFVWRLPGRRVGFRHVAIRTVW